MLSRSPDKRMNIRSLTLLTAACIIVTLPAILGAQARAGSAVRGKKIYYDYSCYACPGFNGETGARTFVPNWPASLASESTFTAFLRGRAYLAPDQPATNMPHYVA